jgi:hypothetical protein
VSSDLSKDFIVNDRDFRPPDGFKSGYIERDLKRFPVGSMFGSSAEFNKDFPLIPRDQWSERITEKERTRSRLSDIRNIGNFGQEIEALDQNGQGFCWSYSTTAAVMLARAVSNLPHVRLSAHSVACKIKNFRDEGGWNGESLEFVVKNGIVPVTRWPEKSMSRALDTQANWDAAKDYRITEGWLDMAQPIWGRELTFDQLATCLLLNVPCPTDFDWWGHSVCSMDLVEVNDRLALTDPERWGIRILNSWKNSWGVRGTGVIVGKKAVPMGATAIRVAGVA